jgi:hypothetical protein
MEITVNYTVADCANAQRYVTRRMYRGSAWRLLPFSWSVLYGFTLGLGGMLLYRFGIEYCGPSDQRLTWGLWLVFAGVVFLATLGFVNGIAARKVVFRPNGHFLSPHTFALSPAGLIQSTEHCEYRTGWEAVEAVEEDKYYLYLFLDRGLATYIPKRSFPDVAAYEDFAKQVDQYVSQKG